MPVQPVAFVTSPGGRAAVVGDGVQVVAPVDEAVAVAAGLERDAAERPVRFTWWAAAADAYPLAARGIPLSRCWDVAEAHRLLHGGWQAGPQQAWAAAHGLDPALVPQA